MKIILTLTTLFNHAANRFKRKGKVLSFFFANSAGCACTYYLNMAKQLNTTVPYPISALHGFSPAAIRADRVLFFFAHGEQLTSRCYLLDGTGRVYIEDPWWQPMQMRTSFIYFHVCYGAKVIENSPVLRNRFTSWVSYDCALVYSRGDHLPMLDAFNRETLAAKYHAARHAKNAAEFKSAMELIYKGMEQKLMKIPAVGNMLVAQMGNNRKGLKFQ